MSKRMMKNKLNFLLGVLLIFSLVLVSSEGADWYMYDNSYPTGTSVQFLGGVGHFDEGTYNLTEDWTGLDQSYYSLANQLPAQPLIMDLGQYLQNFIVTIDGHYLRVLDEDLFLYDELYINETSVNGQLSGCNFYNETSYNEICGMFEINSSYYSFKVFALNDTTQELEEIYDYPFEWTSDNSQKYATGLRCYSEKCWSALSSYNSTAGEVFITLYTFNAETQSSTFYDISTVNSLSEVVWSPITNEDYNSGGAEDLIVFNDDNVVVFTENGNLVYDWTFNADNSVSDVKFVRSYGNPYYRLAVALESYDCGVAWDRCIRVDVKNIIDGTGYSSTVLQTDGNYGVSYPPKFNGMAVWDYNEDGTDDIWITSARTGTGARGQLSVIEPDGSELYEYSSIGNDWGDSSNSYNSMTVAKIDSDDNYDVIIHSDSDLRIWSLYDNSMILSTTTTGVSGVSSCVPADLNLDSSIDLICADSGDFYFLTSNFVNSVPTIQSIALDPSAVVQVNQTLYATISAIDVDSDTILYSHQCYSGDTWSSWTTSATRSCVYDSVGSYALSVAVTDYYNLDTNNSYATPITVTTTGSVCDNDFICEASQGETYINCPNDCDEPSQEEIPDTTTATGGMPIPTQIVNPDNINEGLLPSVYFGTLGFLSSVLSPTITIVFLIFFVLIIITIGMIIKKIAIKVASSGNNG